jgi:hypothetical protein
VNRFSRQMTQDHVSVDDTVINHEE